MIRRQAKTVMAISSVQKKVDVVAEVDEVSAESIDLDLHDQTNQLLKQKKLLKRKGDKKPSDMAAGGRSLVGKKQSKQEVLSKSTLRLRPVGKGQMQGASMSSIAGGHRLSK